MNGTTGIPRWLIQAVFLIAGVWTPAAYSDTATGAVEFCLAGEFDLGARLQGHRAAAGERYPMQWCVTSEAGSDRVRFFGAGRSNPDMEGSFTVSYLPPERVRIVNTDAPDIDFRGALVTDEARSIRRLDPQRLVAELEQHPEWIVANNGGGWRTVRWPGAAFSSAVRIADGRLLAVMTHADLPLRGRVPVQWNWTWTDRHPDGAVQLLVDGQPLFSATARRRPLGSAETAALWQSGGTAPPREVPGKAWPATVRMTVDTLRPGVHLVRGVRTGFSHLVVETREGLVVADAPAGWVELHQLPPADLVPGLGISGLSERFIDFLNGHWPGVPVRAVAITHAHDDHAGGARAFAAAGAAVYAPVESAAFLQHALNRVSMPADRLSLSGRKLEVLPVARRTVLADPEHPVELIAMGSNPHVHAMLGVHLPADKIFFESDIHVPASEDPVPRADRLQSECWFARWATQQLPADTVVHNSHRSVALEVRQLAAYLGHSDCAQTGP